MPFLWIAVDDVPGPESNRGFIERNAIALLSNYDKPAIDLPSSEWLGNHCDRKRVQRSGLWNNNHVDGAYDPEFLDLLERIVNQSQAGRCPEEPFAAPATDRRYPKS